MPDQWSALEAWLAADASIPWEVATEGRRVAQWGYRYDYASHEVDLTPVAPIPPILRQLLHAEPEPERFTQCIINEYGADDGAQQHQQHTADSDSSRQQHQHQQLPPPPAAHPWLSSAVVVVVLSAPRWLLVTDQTDVNVPLCRCAAAGIPWHKDDAAFGNTVLVFSFGEPRKLKLRRLAAGLVAAQAPGDAEAQPESREEVVHSWAVLPAHGSAYLLQGPARVDYQHSVEPGTGRRYSVTFRSSPQTDGAHTVTAAAPTAGKL